MNLGQIRTALQHRGYATDTATAQTELINSVYRRLGGMRRWPWLEVDNNTSITTTAGDPDYDLSTITDLLHVDAVRLTYGTEYYELSYVEYQQFRRYENLSRDNGVPQYWTLVSGNELHIWPRPDKVYTLSIDYIKVPTALTADADTPIFPATYHDILTWGAIEELCFRERDPAGAQMAAAHKNTLLIDMMNEYGLRQRQQATHVRKSGEREALDWERVIWPTW